MSIQRKVSTIVASALMCAGVVANAQVTGSLWEGDLSDNADIVPGGPASVTFTSSQIEYSSGGAYTIGEFLGSDGTVTTINTGASELGNSMDNTHIQLNGTIFLSAGANAFSIGHDDGLRLVLGGGIGNVLDAPGGTSFVLTPFTITAPSSGNYSFTLDYNECCGSPADLEWAYPNGIPVTGAPDGGTTLALMGLSLTGLGIFARRK